MSSARKDCPRELAQPANGGIHRDRRGAKISDPGTIGSGLQSHHAFVPLSIFEVLQMAQSELFDLTRNALAIPDLEDRIRSRNESAERLYGSTAEEVAGRKFHDALYAGQVDVLEKEASVLGETGECAGELCQITKARKTVIVEGDRKFASRSAQQADICFDHQERHYGKADARK
jgi:PAS domain-containing protein